jgi:hypothetical protein
MCSPIFPDVTQTSWASPPDGTGCSRQRQATARGVKTQRDNIVNGLSTSGHRSCQPFTIEEERKKPLAAQNSQCCREDEATRTAVPGQGLAVAAPSSKNVRPV